jgi:ketosteroid isomerase-like protein
MKSAFILIGVIAALFAAGAQAQTPAPKLSVAKLTAAQVAEIEKTILQAHQELSDAANRLSAEAVQKYASTEFQERVGGGNIFPAAPGKEAFLKWLSDIFATRINQKAEPVTVRVQVVSADVAYSIYVGGASFTSKKTNRYGGYGNAITWLWRKEAAGWRIIHCHESWW